MVLRYVIRPATDLIGLKAIRADESSAPGDITTQLLDDLLSAKAIVADLTGLKPNTFYELAVAHSFNRPAVIRQHRRRDRAHHQSLTSALANPGKNSPISRTAEWQPLRHGNPTERAIAELGSEIASLRSDIRSGDYRGESRSAVRPRTILVPTDVDASISKAKLYGLPTLTNAELQQVVSFLNTHFSEGERDQFHQDALREWWEQRGGA